MSLSGKERRHLRALAHDLAPIVLVGKEGLTDALCKAVEQALVDHELIKVKIGQNAPVDRHDAAAQLAKATRSDVAQVLGNHILLYRPDADEPSVSLPTKGKKPAPGKPAPGKPALGKPARGAKPTLGAKSASRDKPERPSRGKPGKPERPARGKPERPSRGKPGKPERPARGKPGPRSNTRTPRAR